MLLNAYTKVKSPVDTSAELRRGIKEVFEVVCSTLGGGGRPVVISRDNGLPPIVTKDGVTVAKNLKFPDTELYSQGARLVIDASMKSNKDTGDGTTTTVALTQFILDQLVSSECPELITKDALFGFVEDICMSLDKKSKKVEDLEQLFNIAKISSNDEHIAKRIKDAYAAVSFNGVVNARMSLNDVEEIIVDKGINITSGLKNIMLNPHARTGIKEVTAEEPVIVVSKSGINDIAKIVSAIKYAHDLSAPIIIVAPDFSRSVTDTLVNLTHTPEEADRLKMPVYLIEGSSFGKRQLDLIDDLAIVFGIEAVDFALEPVITSKNITRMPTGTKVNIFEKSTEIVFADDYVPLTTCNNRLTYLSEKLKHETSYFEREKLEERISTLVGKRAFITYHANSEAESNEIKDRIEDALCSVRAALKEGYIIGAGKALLSCLEDVDFEHPCAELFYGVSHSIIHEIINNSYRDYSVGVKDKEFESIFNESSNLVYNVKTEEVVDAYEAGIIDATQVFRVALNNAVSVAWTVYQIGYSVVRERDL